MWYEVMWCDVMWYAAISICRNFNILIPDAPELVHTFLEQEQDASCKRNAFMMLIHVDQVNRMKQQQNSHNLHCWSLQWTPVVSSFSANLSSSLYYACPKYPRMLFDLKTAKLLVVLLSTFNVPTFEKFFMNNFRIEHLTTWVHVLTKWMDLAIFCSWSLLNWFIR